MPDKTPLQILEHYAHSDDGDIDLVAVALAFSGMEREGVSFQRYENHFVKLANLVRARHQDFLNAGGTDDAGTRLAALRDVIVLDHGYEGTAVSAPDILAEDYDPSLGVDLMSVIDERRGEGIALTLIYAAVAKRAGWELYGLNVAGHFLGRIDCAGQRLVFDPADGCHLLQAHDLRNIVKAAKGDDAELSNDYFEAISKREWLLSLKNRIKFYQIRIEDYETALSTVQAMRSFSPDDARLLLDAGVLYARMGQIDTAIFTLEHYVSKTGDERGRHEAMLLLNDLRDI